jgi:Type I phosphodiesterase / nucleotide pyrophosphatase
LLKKLSPVVVIAVFLASGFAVYRVTRPEVADLPEFEEPTTACDVPLVLLERVARGYYPRRSGDILMIEQPKVQPENTRHSTPYPFTQNVPILLYGPGFIRSGAAPDRPVTVADIAPTTADLLGFDAWDDRDGKVLEEALLPAERRNGVPRLIVTIVWDGGGDNVLEKWPDDHPELDRLAAEGASYVNATAGSSPSITPAVHATIGTGAFPSKHGLPDIFMRVKGEIVDPYEGGSPRFLEASTVADEWDLANDNEPVVGIMARDTWMLGLVGHGGYDEDLPGADEDIAILDQLQATGFHGLEDFEFPDYLPDPSEIQDEVDEVDGRDGEVDGKWLGNDISADTGDVRLTPAWSIFQTQVILDVLTREGFGADDMPDLFLTNYKSVDLGGHEWNMVEPEVQQELAAQDAQLKVLVDGLNEIIGRKQWVLILTADHGMTPPAPTQHNYEMDEHGIKRHIQERFDKVNPNVELVDSNRGYQLFLDPGEMKANDVTVEDVVEFLRGYTIEDNATEPGAITPEIEPHKDEPMFYAVLTPPELGEALACARRKAK